MGLRHRDELVVGARSVGRHADGEEHSRSGNRRGAAVFDRRHEHADVRRAQRRLEVRRCVEHLVGGAAVDRAALVHGERGCRQHDHRCRRPRRRGDLARQRGEAGRRRTTATAAAASTTSAAAASASAPTASAASASAASAPPPPPPAPPPPPPPPPAAPAPPPPPAPPPT